MEARKWHWRRRTTQWRPMWWSRRYACPSCRTDWGGRGRGESWGESPKWAAWRPFLRRSEATEAIRCMALHDGCLACRWASNPAARWWNWALGRSWENAGHRQVRSINHHQEKICRNKHTQITLAPGRVQNTAPHFHSLHVVTSSTDATLKKCYITAFCGAKICYVFLSKLTLTRSLGAFSIISTAKHLVTTTNDNNKSSDIPSTRWILAWFAPTLKSSNVALFYELNYKTSCKWDCFALPFHLLSSFHSFRIYEHVVFVPGPFLNLVLGPNGSGKSAFVCSIIMGCGGDPSITGRSNNISKFFISVSFSLIYLLSLCF